MQQNQPSRARWFQCRGAIPAWRANASPRDLHLLPGAIASWRSTVPQSLGKSQSAPHSATRHQEVRRVDDPALRTFRRFRRNLSINAIRHHGAGCSGLRCQPPITRAGRSRVQEADGGQRKIGLLHAALLFAHLGYIHRRLRFGRN